MEIKEAHRRLRARQVQCAQAGAGAAAQQAAPAAAAAAPSAAPSPATGEQWHCAGAHAIW